jgi:hypothetical protein
VDIIDASRPKIPVSFLIMPTMAFFFLGRQGTKAVNSLVFAEYFQRVVWNATRGDDAPSEVIPHWVLNATAVAVVVLVSVLVVGTRSLGSRTMVIVTSIKVCDPHADPARLVGPFDHFL